MAMYGKLDAVVPGTLDGLYHDFESRLATAVTQFGDPVFYHVGDEKKAYPADVADTDLKFGGIAVLSQRSYAGSEGAYPAKEMVSVATRGEIWVRVPDALTNTANKPAYIIADTANANYKKFTDTSSAATYDGGLVFKGNPITLGTGKTYARVEVRGLK